MHDFCFVSKKIICNSKENLLHRKHIKKSEVYFSCTTLPTFFLLHIYYNAQKLLCGFLYENFEQIFVFAEA